MAVFHTTKVRYSDPIILILLVWIRRSHSGLCGKCKFGDRVGRHLLGISVSESVLLILDGFINRRDRIGLDLIFLDTAILTSRCIAIIFLDLLLRTLGSDISRLWMIHLDLMTSCIIFLNQILNLCRQGVSIDHISI